MPQAEFVVRPGYGPGAHPLIEFRGDHRADGYPPMLQLLQSTLPGPQVTGDSNLCDDHVRGCRFEGGAFEVSDDWGGLFTLARRDHVRVIEAIAEALERTGVFRRIAAAS